MSKARATVPVAWLRDKVNITLAADLSARGFLENLTPEQAFRLGAASLLEAAQLHTDNYKGYGYLPSEWGEDGLREGYDRTRRAYS